jgi:hypothetical protein
MSTRPGDVAKLERRNGLRQACESPRGPELTAAVQASLQLQLNSCLTGSSTAGVCYRRGCPQRLRYAKWAGGSGLLTHRRAALGVFTLSCPEMRKRKYLQLALHAQRTAGLLHVARSAPGRDSRSWQGALARDTQTGRYGRLYSRRVTRRRLCERFSAFQKPQVRGFKGIWGLETENGAFSRKR